MAWLLFGVRISKRCMRLLTIEPWNVVLKRFVVVVFLFVFFRGKVKRLWKVTLCSDFKLIVYLSSNDVVVVVVGGFCFLCPVDMLLFSGFSFSINVEHTFMRVIPAQREPNDFPKNKNKIIWKQKRTLNHIKSISGCVIVTSTSIDTLQRFFFINPTRGFR